MLILLGRCEKYFLNERSHFDQKFYFPKFAYRTLLKVLSDAYETKDTYCNINHICKKKKERKVFVYQIMLGKSIKLYLI